MYIPCIHDPPIHLIVKILIVILIIIIALCISKKLRTLVTSILPNTLKQYIGGTIVNKYKSDTPPRHLINQHTHIVVDGFNMLYYYHDASGKKPKGVVNFMIAIVDMLKWLVPILKHNFSERIMIVFKNQEFKPFTYETREKYKEFATKYQVYIYLCEGLEYSRNTKHAALGRDDFYAAVLARQYKTRILSFDRYKDFDKFVHEVPNFRVYIMDPDKDEPIRITDINAFDYSKEIKKPWTYRLGDLRFY